MYFSCLLTVLLTLGFTSINADTVSDRSVAKAGSNIKCYQCNSYDKDEKDCETSDEDKLKKYIKTCPKISEGTFAGKEANSCRKVLQNVVDDDTKVVRECSYSGDQPIDGKRRTGNKGIILYLYQCFNEGNDKPCNSSPVFGMSLVAMLLSLSAVFWFSKA